MEFVARVKKLIQRSNPAKSKTRVKIGKFSFDSHNNKLFTDKKEIRLTNTENKILLLLSENAGKVVTFECFADALWNTGDTRDKNALHVYIRRLREKIEADASHPRLILNKTGLGYYMSKTE
jgi:DNA-binding response OmpR family regulator